jgi:hypothetical protein
LLIFDLEQVARKHAFSKSEIGIGQAEINQSQGTWFRRCASNPKNIRNVFLRKHAPKRISDIAQAEPRGPDRTERCSFDLPRLPFRRVNGCGQNIEELLHNLLAES